MILYRKAAENPCDARVLSRFFVLGMGLLEGKWCESASAGRLQWLNAAGFYPL